MVEWLRPFEWLFSAIPLSLFIGVALVALAARWPVPVGFSGALDVFGLDGRVCLTMLFGRFDVRTVRTEDGRVDVAIELSLFHFFSIRKRVVGEPSREARPHGAGAAASGDGSGSSVSAADEQSTVHVEDGNVLYIWKFVWQRWRPVVRGLGGGVLFVLRRVRMKQLRVDGQLGFGDPARTAQAYGAMWSLFGLLGVMLQKLMTVERQPDIVLLPVYNQWVLRFQGEGTLTMRLGDSFLGGLVSLWEFVRQLTQRGSVSDEGMERSSMSS